MIGFVTSPETAAAVLAGIDQAMAARGLPSYWTTGSFPIYSGEHTGSVFIPADDTILDAPLMGSPTLTPSDFPEFATLSSMLGGLSSRVDIAQECIEPPFSLPI